MAVAEALDERIFVSPAKWRVMQCCGWSPQQMARFTTLESAARIHVVPMGALSVDRLEARWRSLQAQAVEGGNVKKQGALKLTPKPAPRNPHLCMCVIPMPQDHSASSARNGQCERGGARVRARRGVV